MLEILRQRASSWGMVALLLLIGLVFVISFGPQSADLGGSLSREGDFALKVGDKTLGKNHYRYAFVQFQSANIPEEFARQLRVQETAMDALIGRELLAVQAEAEGFGFLQRK